jgi:rRNA maturation endonuclease Nob1
MVRKKEDNPDLGISEGEHAFMKYGCACGKNFPKEQGPICPSCGETVGEVT